MKGEAKIFGVYDKATGEVKQLVEAQTAKQVNAYLLRNVMLDKPSALTVAKLTAAGMKVEKAAD